MNSSAAITITSALVFYSIGVWSERIAGRLKPWHLVFFVLGLICDTWGTGMMFEYVGGMAYDIHGITGLAAILFMLIHAVWALIVLVRKDEKAIQNFHKFKCYRLGHLAGSIFQPHAFRHGDLATRQIHRREGVVL